MRTFRGIWPALITPFADDGLVNIPVLRRVVDHLLAQGVDGFYLCGSTGEGIYMSVQEREQVAETVLEQVKKRVPVIVHVGAVATRDSVRLARHARQVGAAGVSSILPPVLRDPRGIITHFEQIAAAVPDLPFLPYIFGGPSDAVALLRQLEHIPNLAGSKYTGPNMDELSHIVSLRSEGWTIFSGMDEQYLFGAMCRASGAIGSTLNLMPGVYREIHRANATGDFARGLDLQMRANQVTSVLANLGFLGALKATMGILGFDCGQPRLPNLPLPDDALETLRTRLEAVGFAELTGM